MFRTKAIPFAFIGMIGFLAHPAQGKISWQVVKTSIDQVLDNPEKTSSQGQSIPLWQLKTSETTENSPKFLIQAALHGNETQTTAFVTWLAKRLESGQGPWAAFAGSAQIDIIPTANPDEHGESRYNSRQVNLNRNFGVLWGIAREPNGHKPFSEKETKAIAALMKQQRYLAALDIHGYINWVVIPSAPERFKNVSAHKRHRYQSWTKAVSRATQMLGNYHLKEAASLGDGGAFEDWAFWGNDTLAACLEMRPSDRTETNLDRFESYEKFVFHTFSSAMQLGKPALAQNPVPKTPLKTPASGDGAASTTLH